MKISFVHTKKEANANDTPGGLNLGAVEIATESHSIVYCKKDDIESIALTVHENKKHRGAKKETVTKGEIHIGMKSGAGLMFGHEEYSKAKDSYGKLVKWWLNRD